jgi:hypothetical protein
MGDLAHFSTIPPRGSDRNVAPSVDPGDRRSTGSWSGDASPPVDKRRPEENDMRKNRGLLLLGIGAVAALGIGTSARGTPRVSRRASRQK